MGLESKMICLDNSEWMRNGDYVPTRLDAQQDAASIICSARTESHPENTIGVLSMAGKGVEVLVSPTEDIGKILAAFSRVTNNGTCDFSSSIQIAQLALKHRKNKVGGQRIILFVGSPVKDDVKSLQKLGKQLKKNNIAVDVVLMGEIGDNQDKMGEFVNAANSNDDSHLIVVPPGVLPSDAVINSPIILGDMPAGAMGGSSGGASGGGGGMFEEYGGIDPSLDPELAMAIRASTEEARQYEEERLAAAAREAQAAVSSAPNASSSAAPAPAVDEEDEEALLQAALAISMQDFAPPSESAAAPAVTEAEDAEDDDDQEAIRQALEMSLDIRPTDQATAPATASNDAAFLDPEFVSQLLGSVDVDLNDPLIQAALQQLQSDSKEGDGDDDKNKRAKHE